VLQVPAIKVFGASYQVDLIDQGIIWNYRFSRAVVAASCGMGLAVWETCSSVRRIPDCLRRSIILPKSSMIISAAAASLLPRRLIFSRSVEPSGSEGFL